MAWIKYPKKNMAVTISYAYNGDMSPDDVMSPDSIDNVIRGRCIISDGMMMPSTNSKWRRKLVQVAMVFKNI